MPSPVHPFTRSPVHAMLYTGIDLIEISRIERAVARWGERFLRRVYTAGELAAYRGRLPACRIWPPAPSAIGGSWTRTTAEDRSERQEPTRSLRCGQAFGEQADDVAPGPLCVPWVVADAGDHGVVDRRVVEGVQGAAVDHEAPVDARGLHLGGERVPLRGRHDRVFRPDPGPHWAANAR